jgi:chaperone protein EcpD
MNFLSRALCAAALIAAGLNSANAGVQINGTRVIYPASQREVSLSMVNDGKSARLIQAWVDSGDARERPENTKAPFMVTPPMARVDPGKGQTLRIMFTGAELPQDRESVFWLNILEIPPKPQAGKKVDAEDLNYLQLAVRSRLKIFYRPAGLPDSPGTALGLLHWRLVREGEGYAMECTNPSAFNVSFSDVAFKNAKASEMVSKGGMCPAKDKMKFTMSGNPDAADGTLQLSVINDFGGFEEREASFTR